MRYRTIWISDIHIGTRACKAEKLIEFLKAVKTDKLYLVGDVIDGWSLKSSWYWPETHTRLVRRILKAAKKTHVIFIPGNHDEAVRPFCPLDFSSIEVKTYDVHVTADEKRIVVLHGDIFDAFVCNLKHVAILGSFAYDAIIWLNNIHAWALERLGARYWSLSEYIKSRARGAINAMRRYEEAALQYARVKKYDGILCGHIHHPEILEQDGILYLNCGDWVENCSAIAEKQDGSFQLLRWHDIEEIINNEVD